MAEGKVLVVDDEKKIVSVVRAYLERDGYNVMEAADGNGAVDICRREQPDLGILDIMLPGIDGWDVCREIRRFSEVPIIMLTARDEDSDKLVGLGLGADDYMTKPFSPRELVARVRAVLRRSRTQAEPVSRSGTLVVGELVLDEERYEVTCAGKQLSLTPTEFRILAALARKPGRVLSRSQLLDIAFGESFEGYERTIDAHVKNIRHKLADMGAGKSCFVTTVRGVGYKIQEHNDA